MVVVVDFGSVCCVPDSLLSYPLIAASALPAAGRQPLSESASPGRQASYDARRRFTTEGLLSSRGRYWQIEGDGRPKAGFVG